MFRLARTKQHVTIAGETFSPPPLNLEQTLTLLFMMAPYVALVEEAIPDFKRAMGATNGSRPALLSALFISLAGKMQPADITRAFGLLLGKSDEWMVKVRAAELVEALPVLDEVNDFYALYVAVKRLGVGLRYSAPGKQRRNGTQAKGDNSEPGADNQR